MKMKCIHAFQQNASEYTFFLCFTAHASERQWSIESWLCFTSNLCIFCPHRATIEEVEGDVCELESKLDKVSTAHEKHCLIVRFLHRASQQQHKPSCQVCPRTCCILSKTEWKQTSKHTRYTSSKVMVYLDQIKNLSICQVFYCNCNFVDQNHTFLKSWKRMCGFY